MAIWIFSFLILLNLGAQAIDCDSCEPLSEVSITNKGLAKIIEVSMAENLKRFNDTVKNRADFKNLTLDRSQCKTQTIASAWKNRTSDDDKNCMGLPDLSDDLSISSTSLLRPYKANIDQLKLNQINLALAGPVKCEKFKCDFDIQISDMAIDGRFQLDYTDKPEGFVPPTPFQISTTQQAGLKFSGQILVDPQSGKLNDLVFLNNDKSKFDLSPSNLNLNMKLQKPFPSKDAEIKMRGNAFRRLVDLNPTKSAAFIKKQYEQAIENLEFEYRIKHRSSTSSLKDDIELSGREVRKKIIEKYGSEAKFKKNLEDIQWPDPNDDQAINAFLNNPPAEVFFFPKIVQKLDRIDLAANAENAGFSNDQAYMMMTLAVTLTNMAGEDPLMVKSFIEPLLQKEVVPSIQRDVNTELRELKQYWDQISKVPTLNTEDLKKAFELEKKLAATTNEDDRKKIRREIIDLAKKNEANWLPIDTEVIIDQNTRQGQLLKAQIFKASPNCSALPKKISDDTDMDFDLRTEIGPESLQAYFNELAKNKKLSLCMDSEDQETCRGGIKINFTKPPKVSCDNGDFKMDIDIETAKSIFNVDITGNIKAKIQNCGGDPCLQFTDSNGRFKNVILNTFFGGFLQRGLRSALNESSNMPMNIPFVKLQKLQTSPKDCKTKLDWEIRP